MAPRANWIFGAFAFSDCYAPVRCMQDACVRNSILHSIWISVHLLQKHGSRRDVFTGGAPLGPRNRARRALPTDNNFAFFGWHSTCVRGVWLFNCLSNASSSERKFFWLVTFRRGYKVVADYAKKREACRETRSRWKAITTRRENTKEKRKWHWIWFDVCLFRLRCVSTTLRP